MVCIIGENLNASRKLRVDSKRICHEHNKNSLAYMRGNGTEGYLDLSAMLSQEAVQSSGLVPYVGAAILAHDTEYIGAIAQQQAQSGADYIDICVDEALPDPDKAAQAMSWMVGVVQSVVSVPISIDSSHATTILAGLQACDPQRGKPIVNSVNLEPARRELLPQIVESNARVIGNASGAETLPQSVSERLDNIKQLWKLMDEAGLPVEDRILDPLVFPISANPQSGLEFFETVSRLRDEFGNINITGGFSNVSFGLPRRIALNRAFTYMAIAAGANTAFVDPSQFDKQDLEQYHIACEALTNRDEYCMNYISFFRS